MKIGIIEWRAWNSFLLPYILPQADRIPFDLFNCEWKDISELVNLERYSVLCFQLNLTKLKNVSILKQGILDKLDNYGITGINVRVRDISKTWLHSHLDSIDLPCLKAKMTGDPNELLFVKTDLNYGGHIERTVKEYGYSPKKLVDSQISELGPYCYYVKERKDIPLELWLDKSIVIEKFVCNSLDAFFRVYFSGIQLVIVKAHSESLVKKLSGDAKDINYITNLAEVKLSHEVASDFGLSQKFLSMVAQFVELTNIDFGCIDIVFDDNENYFIVDINSTPFAGKNRPDKEICDFLALGIVDPNYRCQ